MSVRIGIDVGGTHTDAVILDGDGIIAATKALTSADVVSGVEAALDEILKQAAIDPARIDTVMIGTTQFTNAIVERRSLAPVAAIRIGLPSGRGLPPMMDWPEDIRGAVGDYSYQIRGGYLYDGVPLAELDLDAVDGIIVDIKAKGLTDIAIASAFSPMNSQPEIDVAARIKDALPKARITLSHPFGRLGLMERENAAILNAALLPLADRVVNAFLKAAQQRGLHCPVYISQNDGTLMSSDFIRAFPALTFASGPTNSLRGAYKLTGVADAIVVDIGGTTSDIGVLQDGFPRESNVIVEVGGVRTNFRMPDIFALGLGGGSLVSADGSTIGPLSVGHRLVTDGRVFGGETMTATDIVVAGGFETIGDPSQVAALDPNVVATARTEMHAMLDRSIEMMKPGGADLPIILVGGGSVLVTGDLTAGREVIRPENAGVANAIGAAIAQIGGEAERMVSYRQMCREEAIAAVRQDAEARAIAAGADRETLRTVDIEETAVPYMDDGATRLRVKVIGDIARGEA